MSSFMNCALCLLSRFLFVSQYCLNFLKMNSFYFKGINLFSIIFIIHVLTQFGLCLLILCKVFLINTLVDFYGLKAIPSFLCYTLIAVYSIILHECYVSGRKHHTGSKTEQDRDGFGFSELIV